MNQTKIKAEVVAHSLSSQGDELVSMLCTFPRIILAEVNTHRMLSKNTSSSRAIPFNKMVGAIQNDPFIPIAWQKEHKGMQGNEYLENKFKFYSNTWIEARDKAIECATSLHETGHLTKQLCNRLLEPFMWTTMLITGSREGWDNFHSLRNSIYELNEGITFKSKKEMIAHYSNIDFSDKNDLWWLSKNKGQAEIHMMALAECIYDAVNESTPKQLKAGEWHIPFEKAIVNSNNWIDFCEKVRPEKEFGDDWENVQDLAIKSSVAMAARTSYTIVGEEKEIDYQKMIDLHDRLVAQNPPHSSPMEHACQAVTDEEYNNSFKGQEKGWFRNYKGFKSYRQVIEESK